MRSFRFAAVGIAAIAGGGAALSARKPAPVKLASSAIAPHRIDVGLPQRWRKQLWCALRASRQHCSLGSRAFRSVASARFGSQGLRGVLLARPHAAVRLVHGLGSLGAE